VHTEHVQSKRRDSVDVAVLAAWSIILLHGCNPLQSFDRLVMEWICGFRSCSGKSADNASVMQDLVLFSSKLEDCELEDKISVGVQ